jgi:DNA-binding MarR family transcriptional regulator
MAEVDIDRILENMFNIMLVIHKKILRMDLELETVNLNRLHVAIMGLLNTADMTMTELAKSLMMTKPQLTHLVETLVALGFVERLPDATDRRVIHLTLTKNGRVKLKDLRAKLKENIKGKLASLTPKELNQMDAALELSLAGNNSILLQMHFLLFEKGLSYL